MPPLYLSAATIRESTERLAESGAGSTLIDFLIFKRAAVLARKEAEAAGRPAPMSVVTGLGNQTFVRAHEEAAATDPNDSHEWTGLPFYSPFGSNRDKSKGYKKESFPSNGPSDTASGWQNRPKPPLEWVTDTSRPKEYRFVERSGEDLANFLLTNQGDKPSLEDFAVWWFRARDLEERLGLDPNLHDLVEATISDFALSEVEIEGLFGRSAEAEH